MMVEVKPASEPQNMPTGTLGRRGCIGTLPNQV
jgi:hypothetical protein